MYRYYYLLIQVFFLLASHEQLSFLDNGKLYQVNAFETKRTCQDDLMHLHCSAPEVLKIYGATYHQTKSNNCTRKTEYCAPDDKTSLISKHCKGRTECNVTVVTSTMGDNCPSMSALKYLNVMYACGPPHKVSATRTKYTCQGDSLNISCSASEVLKIFKATYLREENEKICTGRRMNNVNTAEYCAPDDKTNLLKKHCEGHSKCNVTVDMSTMGDKCPWMSDPKDLNVKYGCEELPPTTEAPFTFAENKSTIVLTKPSSPFPPFNYTTQPLPTEKTPRMSYTTYPGDDTGEDDSAGYGFVIFNTGYGNQISHVMIVLLFVVNFHFQTL